MPRHGTTDYAFLAKTGFLLGVSLFVLGAIGGLVVPTFYGPLPEWEMTLFFYFEVIGTLVGLISPLLFGIVFPLTR